MPSVFPSIGLRANRASISSGMSNFGAESSTSSLQVRDCVVGHGRSISAVRAGPRRLGRRPGGPVGAPRHVQSAGSLSGRKRISFVPCRKRFPCTLSYRTSATSSGRSAVCSSSPVPQRFGSEKRRSLHSSSSGSTSALISSWLGARRPRPSRRSRSRRRRGRGRAAASRASPGVLFQRTPMTTQSAVLCSFTLTTPSREPGRYGSPSRFATTPSRPAASKRSSQAVAAARSRVAGEIQNPSPRRRSSARRSSSGRSWTGSPSQSSRSNAM